MTTSPPCPPDKRPSGNRPPQAHATTDMHVYRARTVFPVGAIGTFVALHFRSAPIVESARAHAVTQQTDYLGTAQRRVNRFEKSQY